MRKKLIFTLTIALFLSWFSLFAQDNKAVLRQLSDKYHAKYALQKQKAMELAKEKGWIIRSEVDGKYLMELMGIDENGRPYYNITENLNSAKTIDTDHVWNGGVANLDFSGEGFLIGEWDGGLVRDTHQEFVDDEGNSRVTQRDVGDLHYHSTHVAGTLIAEGQVGQAKGMAYKADLDSYDWDDDLSEMATAAADDDLIISNHSYGVPGGWYYSDEFDRWYWYGNTDISETEDYFFGFYNDRAQDWDEFAYNAPQYLIVKSAGNERNDFYDGWHRVLNPETDEYEWSEADRDPDGNYDCIGGAAVAKNILTVGSCWQITNGYDDPADVVSSEFSSWGPIDDGRIKPDVVADGEDLYSTFEDHDSHYESIGGTSMATPAVAGSAVLIQEHYHNLNEEYMKAATLKGLIIHTTDEAGSDDGPDYMFGWGKMNTERAVDLVTYSNSIPEKSILEENLANGETKEIGFYWNGEDDIKVTICWTDPEGTPVAPELDPDDKMLVNDLDIRLISEANLTHYPWSCDPAHPGNAATNNGDNDVDNVEQIFIDNPVAGYYTLQISHKGNIGTGQDFALIYSGLNKDNTNTWLGSYNRYWSQYRNWSLGHVPLEYEDVKITTEGSGSIIVDYHDAICNNLTIEADAHLNVKDITLEVLDDMEIYGTLEVSDEPSHIRVTDDIIWHAGSQADVALNSSNIYLGGDWVVNSGANAMLDAGYVEFNGTSQSNIKIFDANNSFYYLRAKKDNNFIAVSVDNDNDLNVHSNIYVYDTCSFRHYSLQNMNLLGNLSNQGGIFEFFLGRVVYQGSTHSLNSGENDFYSEVEIDCSQVATLFNDIEIRSDFIITNGTFNTNGYNMIVKGDWINNAGINAFLENTGTVYFTNIYIDQSCSNETFHNLVVDKSNKKFKIDGTDVLCSEFDYESGIMEFTEGSFTADDLIDSGIYGTWNVSGDAEVNLTQQGTIYPDLNATLNISETAEFNIFGQYASYWGYSQMAVVNMDGGTLYIEGGIKVTEDFSCNITAGTISTSGYFESETSSFSPTGGTVKLVGGDDTYIRMNYGYLHNVEIDKISRTNVKRKKDKKSYYISREGERIEKTRSNTVTQASNLDIRGDFIITNGVYDSNSFDMTLGRNWKNLVGENGYLETTQIVTFSGSGSADIVTDETFYEVVLDKTYIDFDALELGIGINGADVTILNNLFIEDGSFELNSPSYLSVGETLTIQADGKLNANDTGTIEIVVGNNWIDNSIDGFDAGNYSNVTFTSDLPGFTHLVEERQSFNDLVINSSASWLRPRNNIAINSENIYVMNGTLQLASNNVYVENDLIIEGNLDMSDAADSLFVDNISWVDGCSDNVTDGNIFVTGDWTIGSGANVDLSGENNVHMIGISNSVITCNEPGAGFNNLIIEKTNNIADSVLVPANNSLSANLINVNSGKLEISEGCDVDIKSELTADSNLQFNGTLANPINVASSIGYYTFDMNDGSGIQAVHTKFSKMGESGINIKNGASVISLSNCSFSDGIENGTLLTINNSQDVTINNAEFVAGSLRDASFNVAKTLAIGSVTFNNTAGSFSGPSYENDPYNRINWEDFTHDLEITNVEWTEVNPIIGDMITVTVTIANNGVLDIANGQNFFLDIFYNENVVPEIGNFGDDYQQYSLGIPAYSSIDLMFNVESDTAEEWNTYFILDTDQILDESDETNNIFGPEIITWQPIPVVTDLTLNVVNNDVVLNWSYPSECDSYNVYRSIDPHDFTEADVINVIEETYSEPISETKYFYRVTAVKSMAAKTKKPDRFRQ